MCHKKNLKLEGYKNCLEATQLEKFNKPFRKKLSQCRWYQKINLQALKH